MIRRALLLVCLIAGFAGCPSAKEPQTPIVELPGIDTSTLTEREKREFSAHVTSLAAPCADVAVPVSQCVTEKRPCARCMPAARAILSMVRDGMSREQVATKYKSRYDPASARAIPVEGSPVRGPENAPVTIVEFADFECPSCERMYPQLEKILAKYKDQVRFVYKFLPIPFHPHADPAARAAFAAMKQDKFWEMHHLMFESFGKLEPRDIDKHAADLKLDLQRFHADMESPEAKAKIEQDRALAKKLGVEQTPTLFVNGRKFDHQGDIEDWVKTELDAP